MDSHQFGLFLFGTINTTWNRYLELINEFTTQPRGYGETINTIEPSEPQQLVIYVQHTLTETTHVESDNPFRSRIVAIIINDIMTKSLDHVSCADCILDPALPAHEPTTTNNYNPIFG